MMPTALPIALPIALPLLLRVLQSPAMALQLSPSQWDLCLRQAVSANLTATLAAVLDDAGLLDNIDAAARAHLDWAAQLARRHGQAVHWEVRQIALALRGRGIAVILLKGAAYVMAGLPAARGRLFSDIDILVPKSALNGVESDLMVHGWASGHHDPYDQRYYRDWMHELPPMQNVRRQSMIDVHHAILPPTARVHPDSELLRAAAVGIDDAGTGVTLQTLAPADMVLHSATHLFFDGESDHGIRDVVDLDRLLRHFGTAPAFWQQLPRRAAELELSRPLFYALRYCPLLLGTPVPDSVQGDIAAGGRPNRLLLAVMDAMFLRTLMPPHASCADRSSALARFALYVRGNWLRMPPLMLVRHLFHKAFISPRADPAA